ncbi:MAG: phosphatidylglycerophosphatase A [Puniceicoccales bacterium]|jgi:phosphatidylglycerophosphatase A|nr:phosphatidylglycerophosphatase A [Puniceicoccales bacterium]
MNLEMKDRMESGETSETGVGEEVARLKKKRFTGPLARVLTAVATLGPLGTKMPAPGTWGSGAGMLFYAAVLFRYNNFENFPVFIGLVTFFALVAAGICHVAEKNIGRVDPGEVILDEFVAMPFVYFGSEAFIKESNHGWLWFFLGFALFRFFDVLKPIGINKLQRFPGGAGIVLDDLAAALAACGSLHLLHLLGRFFGL